MAYPRPKQVRHKPSTEINPSIVNIRFSPPFPDSLSGFYVNGGSQSLRRGLTAYHPGSPNEILPQIDRNFNRILFSRICGKCFKINLKTISRNKKKDWKSLILRAFQSKCPLFELFPKFLSATLKCWYFLHFGHVYFAKYYSFRIVFKVFSSKLVAVSAPIISHRLDIIYFFITHNE